MAEISREDAIKVLSKDNCVDCACGSSLIPTTQCKWNCKYKDSVVKAISDMEKLQKIEQITKHDCIDDDSILCSDCEFNHCGGYCVEVRMLNDIIKVYKNN